MARLNMRLYNMLAAAAKIPYLIYQDRTILLRFIQIQIIEMKFYTFSPYSDQLLSRVLYHKRGRSFFARLLHSRIMCKEGPSPFLPYSRHAAYIAFRFSTGVPGATLFADRKSVV